MRLGGLLDPVHGRPLPVAGLVQGLHESERYGRQAILRVDGVDVILTERRLAFTTLAQFIDLGLDPLSYRIVCLKLGYLFPDFQRIAPEAIMAFSPGAVNARPETLPFHNIRAADVPLRPRFRLVAGPQDIVGFVRYLGAGAWVLIDHEGQQGIKGRKILLRPSTPR